MTSGERLRGMEVHRGRGTQQVCTAKKQVLESELFPVEWDKAPSSGSQSGHG